MRLAQISDCHLCADPDTRARTGVPFRRLEAVIEAVNRQRPDRVLVTGDISQDASAASYRLAVDALDGLEAPWEWLAGNHDRPALMAEHRELRDQLDADGWRILMPATRVSGQPWGEVGAEGLAWLEARLAEEERPTLLVMHHPPLPVGSAWIDEIGLVDREAFWEVLAPHGQVRAILCGHIHQAFVGHRRQGQGEVAVYGCPSTSDQFLPGAATFAVDEASSPGYRVFDLAGESLATRVERVDL